jgi:hypothetical protein
MIVSLIAAETADHDTLDVPSLPLDALNKSGVILVLCALPMVDCPFGVGSARSKRLPTRQKVACDDSPLTWRRLDRDKTAPGEHTISATGEARKGHVGCDPTLSISVSFASSSPPARASRYVFNMLTKSSATSRASSPAAAFDTSIPICS